MRRTASEVIRELELRVARLESLAEEADWDEENSILAEDLTAEEILAIKRLKPSHVRAIQKGTKKSWKGNQTSRVRSMNKSRNKSNPDRAKNRRRRKLYKKHSAFEFTAGRRYDADEWVFFEHEDHPEVENNPKLRKKAEELRDKFETLIDNLCDDHNLSICYDEGVSEVAWKAYASLVGHGTGLWDMDHSEAKRLEEMVEDSRVLSDLAQDIQSLPYS